MKTVNTPFAGALAIRTRPSVEISERIYRNMHHISGLHRYRLGHLWSPKLPNQPDSIGNKEADVESGHVVIRARSNKPIKPLWHKGLGTEN